MNIEALLGFFGVGILVIIYLMAFVKAINFNDPVQDILLTLAWACITYYAFVSGQILFSIIAIISLIICLNDLVWQLAHKPAKKLNLFKIKH
jgi:hypothetical protein